MASVKRHGVRTHGFRLEGLKRVKQNTAEKVRFEEVSDRQGTTKDSQDHCSDGPADVSRDLPT